MIRPDTVLQHTYLKAIKGNISAQHAYFLETAKMYQQERAQFDYNIHNKFIYQRQQFLYQGDGLWYSSHTSCPLGLSCHPSIESTGSPPSCLLSVRTQHPLFRALLCVKAFAFILNLCFPFQSIL